ncbi:hypothetical protein BDN72DRAFT_834313 [Pluteus cervinus]|uniref:Uncharacterized protein n=1 Tax=Pluteus cervinus TaxID=181527 RepID=A0ACD3B5Y5_9AGAR|nr:hypothetical protein BDN72DRAFT_834313 [Pluteus cervinus]
MLATPRTNIILPASLGARDAYAQDDASLSLISTSSMNFYPSVVNLRDLRIPICYTVQLLGTSCLQVTTSVLYFW